MLRYLILTFAGLTLLLMFGQVQAVPFGPCQAHDALSQQICTPARAEMTGDCAVPSQAGCGSASCLMKLTTVVAQSFVMPSRPDTLPFLLAPDQPLAGYPSLIDHPPRV